jgi:hypothetical protein
MPSRKGYLQWHREAPIPEDMPLSTIWDEYRDDQEHKNWDSLNSNLSERSGSDESSRQEPRIPRSRLMNSRSGFSSRTPFTKNPPDQAQRMAMERDNISSNVSRHSAESKDDESDLISREDDIISAAFSRKSQKIHSSVNIETCLSEDLVSREDEIRSAAASRASQLSSKDIIKNITMIATDDRRSQKECMSSKLSGLSDPILQNRSSEERNPSPSRSHQSSTMDKLSNAAGSNKNTLRSRFDRYSSCQDSVFSEVSDVSKALSTKKETAPTAPMKHAPILRSPASRLEKQPGKHISFKRERSGKGMKSLVSSDKKSSTDALTNEDQIIGTLERKFTEKVDEKLPHQERSIQNEISEFLDSLSVISSNSLFALAKHFGASVDEVPDPIKQQSTPNHPRNASTESTNSRKSQHSHQKTDVSKSGIPQLSGTIKTSSDNSSCKPVTYQAASTRENNNSSSTFKDSSRLAKSIKSDSINVVARDSQNDHRSFYDSVQSDVSDVSVALSVRNKAREVKPAKPHSTSSGSNALNQTNGADSIVLSSRNQHPSRSTQNRLHTVRHNLSPLFSGSESSSKSNGNENLPRKFKDDNIAKNGSANYNYADEGQSRQKYDHSLNDEDDGVSDLSSVSAFLSQKSKTRIRTRQVVGKNQFCLQKRDPPTLSEEIEEVEEVFHDTISDVSCVSAQLRSPSKKINVENGNLNPTISDITESLANESWNNCLPNKNVSYRERKISLLNERGQSQTLSLQSRSVYPIVSGLDVTSQEEAVSRRRRKTSKRLERRSSSESSGQNKADVGTTSARRRKGATSPQVVVDNIPERRTVDPPVAIRISRDPSVSSTSTRKDRK